MTSHANHVFVVVVVVVVAVVVVEVRVQSVINNLSSSLYFGKLSKRVFV